MNNCNYVSILHRFEDISTSIFRAIRLISLTRIDIMCELIVSEEYPGQTDKKPTNKQTNRQTQAKIL